MQGLVSPLMEHLELSLAGAVSSKHADSVHQMLVMLMASLASQMDNVAKVSKERDDLLIILSSFQLCQLLSLSYRYLRC